MTDLTPRERYIYSCLLDVRHDSIWGVAIDLFRDNPTPFYLRQLIKELSEAANENIPAMITIVGEELTYILTADVVCIDSPTR